MTTRRQFIKIVPLAGAAFVVGCSDKPAPPPKVADAAPAPAAVAPPPPAAAPAGAPATPPATSAAPSNMPMVDEKDATAVALGYVADATKADVTKYKTYAAGQNCSGCQLYQGQVGATSGPCTLFAGKQVNAQAWCSAFAKKAA
jgi:High potential iron-sulfur protein